MNNDSPEPEPDTPDLTGDNHRTDRSADVPEPPHPVNWNLLTAHDLEQEWLALNDWVAWLRRTYGLPASVIPPFWHRPPRTGVGAVRAAPALALRLRPRTERVRPSGMLLHGIMSTIAESYSRNLANEVSKGMTQKAATGGTNGKVPMGYLNITKRDELGREIRTVELDPNRAPLVKWAFEAYATGNYSTISLHDELIDRGLTPVPTPKRPSKPPALSTIHKMLTNPYYKGSVRFRGASYDGLHEPLVAPELWYRVQAVLNAHQTSGEKTQTHDHYLKGTLYCGQCGSRLILINAKSRRGVVYPYFICSGRHAKRTNCERKSMFVPDIEAAVENYYRRIQIPDHVLTALRELITAEFDRLHAVAKQEAHAYKAERDALRDERHKLLQAHYAGAVPLDLLASEQDRIARRIAFLDSQIEAGDIEYEQTKAHLDDCLALAGDCHAIYMSINDSLRRLANQAFFTSSPSTTTTPSTANPESRSTCSSTPTSNTSPSATKDRRRKVDLKPVMSPV